MTILIRQAKIIDPNSPFNGSVQDVLIENGIISKIGQISPTGNEDIISSPSLHLSPGWIDIFSHFNDPGLEYKETIETGIAAAAAGGYTEVMLLPNTLPAVSGKSQVEYIIQRSQNACVKVHPMGAVSKQTEGKELAEMYDMHAAGAVAFTDGLKPLQSAGLHLKALQYVKAFNGTIIQIPDNQTISPGGLMNEGIVSTGLGLPGKPMIAEEIQVSRDIQLAHYTESSVHFTGITSPNSIESIQQAKKKGVAVSCSITPAHLYFSDEDLTGYDTNLKLYPPLRNKETGEFLRQALLNGDIDCIASHHLPHEADSKECEFESAQPGMISLETAYAVTNSALEGKLSPEKWVELVCINPRNIFKLNEPEIKEGASANLTMFDPSEKTIFTKEHSKSKSKNSPFFNKELKGKVIATIHHTHLNKN
ncbi:MAG: dihydroorotase [Bacteroidota bacterium]